MNEEEKTFAYIGKILFNHSFCCEEYWCPCNGSSFLDALVDLKDKNPKYKRDVKEIFNRKPKTDSLKDRQIVEKLEEIDYTDLFYAEKVQEILEEKK